MKGALSKVFGTNSRFYVPFHHFKYTLSRYAVNAQSFIASKVETRRNFDGKYCETLSTLQVIKLTTALLTFQDLQYSPVKEHFREHVACPHQSRTVFH